MPIPAAVIVATTNEKMLREMQTLYAGCSKAEPKIFAQSQTLFPGAQDGQNLISWRWSLPSPTDPVWWRPTHAISSYHGNRPTHIQTQTQTHRQDRLQYTAPLNLAYSVMMYFSTAQHITAAGYITETVDIVVATTAARTKQLQALQHHHCNDCSIRCIMYSPIGTK